MSESGFAYIRKFYDVPAKKGGRVIAYGKPGVITGVSGPHLRIRLDGEKLARPYHPTWEMEYLTDAEGAGDE